MEGTARYLPIGDYAIIGDSRSAALVSRSGSIDWLCWPRFHSPSIFARIIDSGRGGSFALRPSIPFTVTRSYVGDTNVLETTFHTDAGTVRLTDLMPALNENEKRRRLTPLRALLRRLEGIDGNVPMLATYEPRPDYARTSVALSIRRDTVCLESGPEVLYLRSDVPFVIVEGESARAELTLAAGARHYFALGYDSHSPAVFPSLGDEADWQIERTLAYWNEWIAKLTFDGPYRAAVARSALVLKLLAYAPSGAIVAAPTTSLPESIGGTRNWDYRYCWLRDASFTVAALYDCGFDVEGAAFVDWMLYATRLTHPGLQVLYDVFGESRVPETTIDHLDGYLSSRPVRVGNEAHDQFQLDVYGEVLGAVEEFTDRGERLSRDTRTLISRLADMVVKRWREPDSGIWEKRSGVQQHVHAKVMAWSALDCAERLARKGRLQADPSAWKRNKEEIMELVLRRGFNAELNSFVSVLDGNELDASLLYIARAGFLPPDDPRVLGTIDAIRKRLGHDDLVYRYEIQTEDGLPPGEGAFLPCSFWLIEALATSGRIDEGREMFEKMLSRGNDLGLFSEEIDVESGALLGNFPQALTHIALINAALCLQQPVARRGEERETSHHSPAASPVEQSP
ncbi:MAG TPA: glycoside hydrolase family 15 protein [Thermoanaerobaculia bacterium]|nr:glycoside hydrolase family 15 protein [Thermoanaerobaculia bacterium]